MYIATDTAGLTWPPLIDAIKKITRANAAPITKGFPLLAKIARMKKNAPTQIKLAELVRDLDVNIIGNPDCMITGVASLNQADAVLAIADNLDLRK